MKHDPAWERALRHRVRTVLRTAPPDVRRIARHVKPARAWTGPARVLAGRLLGAVILGTGMFIAGLNGSPMAAAAVFALWSLVALLWGPGILLSQMNETDMAYLTLPVSRAQLRTLAVRRVVLAVWRPAFDAAVACAVLLAVSGGSWLQGLAALPAIGLYSIGMWSAALMLTRVPLPALLTSSPFFIALVVFVVARIFDLEKALFAWFVANAGAIAVIAPGGWVARGLLATEETASAGLWVWLPAVALAACAGRAWRILRTDSDPEPRLLWSYCNEVDEDEREAFNEVIGAWQSQEDEAKSAESLKARDDRWHLTLTPPDDGGWIERLLLCWLTARDRLVLEFTLPAVPAWTRQAWHAALILFGGVALLHASAWMGGWAVSTKFVGCGVLAIAFLRGGPFPGSIRPPASPPVAGAPGGISGLGLFPIGPVDLNRLAWKTAAARGLAFAPAMAIAGWMAAPVFDLHPLTVAWASVKMVLLMILGAPWFVVSACSQNTANSRGRILSAIALVLAALVIVAGGLGLAVGALLLPLPFDLLAIAAAGLLNLAMFRLFRVTYDRGQFDLMAAPKT